MWNNETGCTERFFNNKAFTLYVIQAQCRDSYKLKPFFGIIHCMYNRVETLRSYQNDWVTEFRQDYISPFLDFNFITLFLLCYTLWFKDIPIGGEVSLCLLFFYKYFFKTCTQTPCQYGKMVLIKKVFQGMLSIFYILCEKN